MIKSTEQRYPNLRDVTAAGAATPASTRVGVHLKVLNNIKLDDILLITSEPIYQNKVNSVP